MCHPRRFVISLPLLLATILPAVGQDAVVFPDGHTIRGKYGKEATGPTILDSPFDQSFPCDYLNAGAKWMYFSNNAKKGIQLIKGVKEEKEKELEYKRPAGQGIAKLPQVVGTPKIDIGKYNADGRRTVTIKSPGYPEERIVQVASFITPRYVYLSSITHSFRQVYSTSELGPVEVRELLSNHPDLRDGWLAVPDPMKRVKIAEFMLACGWRAEAKAELDRTKKEMPWAWVKEATDKFDQVSAAIDADEVSWVLNELEIAVAAGQYKIAGQVLKTYQPKAADKAALDRLTKLKATIETLQPKFDAARAHLRSLIDEVIGADKHPAVACVSGPVVIVVPGKAVPVEWKGLIPGSEAVYAELHPDSFDRIETFAQVADQMARERAGGRPSKSKPEQALALAVTGWLMGKNGAKNDPVYAAKVWNTRAMVTAYLNERAINARAAVLRKYQQSSDASLAPDEIAQIVTLLPPIDAENLTKRRGKLVDPKQSGVPDAYKMESGPLPDDSDGVTYYVRLPREYHHGRSYPVVVAIHDPTVPAAAMIGRLAAECDHHGYILVAPEWASAFGDKSFDYMGRDHRIITSTIRDVSRKFSADQDRVFAFGFGQGGTFALDLAMSRPDQFAGVVTMAAAPVPQFYREYAKNAQKLAVYSVSGELAPGTDGLRKVYQNWLPYGFYSILSVYKGRGPEWYAAEVPTIFDWMNRKKRVRGLESLRMDGNRFDAWHSFRESDNRFYWVGVDLMSGNTLTAKKAERPDNPPLAASFSADIINGNTIVVKTSRGVKKVTVWLERGMIDWEKEVKFSIDSGVDRLKPTKVKPDLELMLEELYRTGDRKMLFFAKFEFRIN